MKTRFSYYSLRGCLRSVRRLKPRLQEQSPPARTKKNPGFSEPAEAGFAPVAATLVAKLTFQTSS